MTKTLERNSKKQLVAQAITALLTRNKIGSDEVDDVLDLAREKMPRNKRLKKESAPTSQLPINLASP